MIKLENITKTYKRATALDKLNFNLKQGDYVSIIGKSGAGKSTLLNIIAGIDSPTEGDYYFEDKKITSNIHKLTKFRAQNIGIIVQNFALINNMNIYNNIALPLVYMKYNKDEIKHGVREIAASLEIEDKLINYPNELSGGECQKVAIARAVIKRPKILLADEPTGSLDYESKKIILNILKNLNKQSISIIMVTHDLEVANQSNMIYTLENGVFL